MSFQGMDSYFNVESKFKLKSIQIKCVYIDNVLTGPHHGNYSVFKYIQIGNGLDTQMWTRLICIKHIFMEILHTYLHT